MCSMRQGADHKAKWAHSVRACITRPLEGTRRHICEATDDRDPNRRTVWNKPARPLEGARPRCKGTDDNRQARWHLRKQHKKWDGDKMKWSENTISEEVRQTGTDAKKRSRYKRRRP